MQFGPIFWPRTPGARLEGAACCGGESKAESKLIFCLRNSRDAGNRKQAKGDLNPSARPDSRS
jgi:hypothetical protein